MKRLLLVGCILVTSCARQVIAPKSDVRVMLQLNNHGGYSHPGRIITLYEDGRYTEVHYTDCSSERPLKGTFSFDTAKLHLTLLSKGGGSECLCRVDYGGLAYWAPEQDQHRIRDPSNVWERQTSLRSGKP